MHNGRRAFFGRVAALAATCLPPAAIQAPARAADAAGVATKAIDGLLPDDAQLLGLLKQATGTITLDRVFELRRPLDIDAALAIELGAKGGIEMAQDFPAGEFLFRLRGKGSSLAIRGGQVRSHSRAGLVRTFQNGRNKISLTGVRASGFGVPRGGLTYCYDVDAFEMRDCVVEDCENGVLVFGNSRNITIVGNEFRRWRVNAIRVSGFDGEHSENIRIEGNRATDSLGNQSGIYVTCVRGARHRTVTISKNTVIGRGLGYPAGNADLISTWGIEGLTCDGNTSRLGGDLGLAIEEVYDGTVTNNVCELNNWGGITVQRSQRVKVIGNTCVDNGLDRDNKIDRRNNPLAGIKVMGPAESIAVTGNTCTDTSGGKYQDTGILVNEVKAPVRDVVMENNKATGHRLGPTYRVPARPEEGRK